MTPFDHGEWVAHLAQALAQVNQVEGNYLEELAERRWQREQSERDFPRPFLVWDPAQDLRSFYHHACYSDGRYFERRYAPLRAALRDAEHILAKNPVLAEVVKAERRGYSFRLRILNAGTVSSSIGVVAGLMCRARQVGERGSWLASSELQSLLDPSLEEGSGSDANKLAKGYHVSLFYGLQLSEGVEIGGDLTAVPLERTSTFLNREELQSVAPNIAREMRWKEVGAILKPFLWKPTLLSPGDQSEPQLDWGGSFVEDARAFVEILSVSHGVPIVSLLNIPYCTNRWAMLLLGQPHYHRGTSWKSWAQSFGGLRESHEIDIDALNQAKQVFWADRAKYKEFAPIVSRLSEALARTGQYAAEDKIMDVAIALERMYELDQGEISFKLKTRAACFLESDTQSRLGVFRDVGLVYEARSGIVHRRTRAPNLESQIDAFKKGFEVARRSVLKLIRDGSPRDWNRVVMSARNND